MDITIIYDSMNKNYTYNCVQLLLHNLKVNINLNITEFYLPENYGLPPNSSSTKNPCVTYLSVDNTKLILSSLKKSDLIILASQVSNCDVSIGIKTLLQDLSYYCMTSTLKPLMHNKIGVVVSTAAGAGLFHSTKILKKNLNLLGMSYIFKFSETLYEMNWQDISLKTKMKINKNAFNVTYKILNLYNNLNKSKSHFSDTPILLQTASPLKTDKDNVIDITYLRRQESYRRRRI